MKNDKGPYGLLIPGLHFQSPVTGATGADAQNALTLAATANLLSMHPPQKDPTTGEKRPPELDTHQIIAAQLRAAMS